MTSCAICLEEFARWELQNPKFCCSVLLCQSCYTETKNISCPQCRNGSSTFGLEERDNVLFSSNRFLIAKTEDNLVVKWHHIGQLRRSNYGNAQSLTGDGDLPSMIMYNRDGQKVHEQWHRNGDLLAEISYYENGQKEYECWYHNNKLHMDDDLPAEIGYNEDGQKTYEQWYQNRQLHRDGGLPAVILYNIYGQKECEQWYKNGLKLRSRFTKSKSD